MVPKTKVGLCAALLIASGSLTGISSKAHATQVPSIETYTGAQIADAFGTVSNAGDVDNDGFPDIMVGASGNDFGGLGAGRVYVYSGKSRQGLFTFTGETDFDYFGAALSSAGDVDADGFDDIIIGAWGSDAGGMDAGRAYVYSGKTQALLYTFTGSTANGRFGKAVSGAGDVNNDGFDDLVVGEYYLSAVNQSAGSAYVYSGKTGALLYTLNNGTSDFGFGLAVSRAGDVNNDGFADIIVGAKYNKAGGSQAGRAYVFSGQTGGILYTFTGQQNYYLGASVSGAGDVDSDGFDDVIIGSPGSTGSVAAMGRASVYSGQTGALLITLNGESPDDHFGVSVSGVGDVNNDGFADIFVGASGNDNNGAQSGSTYVFSGLTGLPMYTLSGEASGDQFGASVSGATDINNDGYSDFIIGAPTNDAGGMQAGRAYLFLGGCCTNPGDANGDGIFNISDVSFGIAWIFSGGATPGCQGEADADGNNTFNIADITYGIERIFAGGVAPSCGTTAR